MNHHCTTIIFLKVVLARLVPQLSHRHRSVSRSLFLTVFPTRFVRRSSQQESLVQRSPFLVALSLRLVHRLVYHDQAWTHLLHTLQVMPPSTGVRILRTVETSWISLQLFIIYSPYFCSRHREDIVMDYKFRVLSWFGRFEPRRRQAVRSARSCCVPIDAAADKP